MAVIISPLCYNFEEGSKRVNANLSLFDKINLVDTTAPYTSLIAYYEKHSGRYGVLGNDINWFNKNFRQSLLDLANTNRSQSPGLEVDDVSPDLGPQR